MTITTLVVKYLYDPWGKLVRVTDQNGNTITDAESIALRNPFRYRGYYYDTDTGWYYLNSRYYDPETGRFLNADEVVGLNESIISYNAFAYCGNNPVNRIDQSGHSWLSAISNGIKSVKKAISNIFGYQSTFSDTFESSISQSVIIAKSVTGTRSTISTTKGEDKPVVVYSQTSRVNGIPGKKIGYRAKAGKYSIGQNVSRSGLQGTIKIQQSDDQSWSISPTYNLLNFSITITESSSVGDTTVDTFTTYQINTLGVKMAIASLFCPALAPATGAVLATT